MFLLNLNSLSKTCEDLPAHPSVVEDLLETGRTLARSGKIEEAVAQVSRAVELEPKLAQSAEPWQQLCHHGGLWNQPTDSVLDACDRAIRLAPDSGPTLASRAIVRASRGDTAGALDNLQTLISTDPHALGAWGTDSRGWAQTLRAGENPFDAATLEQLRQQ